MTARLYSELVEVRRRYVRSINLERDLYRADAVEGYVVTPRAAEALVRLTEALTESGRNRAFTFTGVYGTGKSACAHFFASLCAPADEAARRVALAIAEESEDLDVTAVQRWRELPAQGYLLSVTACRREPLALSVFRALYTGVVRYWERRSGRRPRVVAELHDLWQKVQEGYVPTPERVLSMLQKVARRTPGVVLILDELGKALEFAVHHPGATDLYLLQEIAELPNDASAPPVLLLGILHQAFADYGQALGEAQRQEWGKVQGRFEDIPFAETGGQLIRLVGAAIRRRARAKDFGSLEQRWRAALRRMGLMFADPASRALPLHPLTAIALPMLSMRLAQNDRSMFSFLTSPEPYGFQGYLAHTSAGERLPTFRLPNLFDYFDEILATGEGVHQQRWVEVRELLEEQVHRPREELDVLKTVGMLNLLGSTGELRARQDLVVAALVDDPEEIPARRDEIVAILESLVREGVLVHRVRADEYRLWRGTDFDVEGAVQEYLDANPEPELGRLESLLGLPPMLAARHSFDTGTMRLFERRLVGAENDLKALSCLSPQSDGVVAYWLGAAQPSSVPARTRDGRPLVLLVPDASEHLRTVAREYLALEHVSRYAPQLEHDGVARREVRARLHSARRVFESVFRRAFAHRGDVSYVVWVNGAKIRPRRGRELNELLSDVCDEAYPYGLLLHDELLNRRRLTSQAAQARRVLIAAMLQHPDEERFGLSGDGPEVTMYRTLLQGCGIHRKKNGRWEFSVPTAQGKNVDDQVRERRKRARKIWDEIERRAKLGVTVAELFRHLQAPPFGLKEGPLPVFLAAVLAAKRSSIGLFHRGTFVPNVGPQHFELLVKRPDQFELRVFDASGSRGDVLVRLGQKVFGLEERAARRLSLLEAVTGLVQFAISLPKYTKHTTNLSSTARAVRDALLEVADPEALIFVSLPKAVGARPVQPSTPLHATAEYVERLKKMLGELAKAHLRLLHATMKDFCAAFRVPVSIPDVFDEELSSKEYGERLDAFADRLRRSFIVPPGIERLSLDRRLQGLLYAIRDQRRAEEQGALEWYKALLLILMEKPVDAWSDHDADRFAVVAQEFGRRWENLVELYWFQRRAEQANDTEFAARLLTVTQPDGAEFRRVLWVKQPLQELAKKVLERLSAESLADPELLEALLLELAEVLKDRYGNNAIHTSAEGGERAEG